MESTTDLIQAVKDLGWNQAIEACIGELPIDQTELADKLLKLKISVAR